MSVRHAKKISTHETVTWPKVMLLRFQKTLYNLERHFLSLEIRCHCNMLPGLVFIVA